VAIRNRTLIKKCSSKMCAKGFGAGARGPEERRAGVVAESEVIPAVLASAVN